MKSAVVAGLAVLVVQSVALVVLDWLLPGLQLTSALSAAGAVLAIAVLNVVLWPLLVRLLGRLNILVFAALSLLLNGACVLVAARLLPGLEVDGLWTAFLTALIVTVATTIVTTLFAFEDADYYTRWATQRIVKRQGTVTTTDVPGVVFLEIDGLSLSVMHHALEAGDLPTLKRWIDGGSHRLIPWECDLPCQTSASQAGILHGNNQNIPAFRWVEKETGRVMVSNHPKDTRELEERISDGQGLLAGGGVSRGNMFSGDAESVMLTFSTLLDKSRNRSSDYAVYLATPVNLTRTIALVLWDILLESWARGRAKLGHVEPHGHRSFPYPLVRAVTTTFLRDVSVYSLIGDMYRGVPSAYVTLVGYDEVAHHSGVLAPDAMAVLRRIDHQLARIERAAPEAPRPYTFIVLSDHGQTQGATFKQRYGITLGELVQRLIDPNGTEAVADITYDARTGGYVNAFLTETVQGGDGTLNRLTRTAVKGELDDGVVELGPHHPAAHPARPPAPRDGDAGPGAAATPAAAASATAAGPGAQVTVLASGNLGLVYFNDLPGRVTYETIVAAFPALIPGLIQQEGIGFVMVRSAQHGPIALGARGVNFLAQGRVEGEDPLPPFGPRAVRHLLRVDGFSNTPDLLVNSFYDPVKDEAAAFEELIGGHGGLGGNQMLPFVLYPSALHFDGEEIVGAEHLHRVLQDWKTEVQGPVTAGPPGDAAPAGRSAAGGQRSVPAAR